MSDLNKLTQNAEALLLAEVTAWLHDDLKHTDKFISGKVSGTPPASGRQDANDLIPSRNVSLLGRSIQFLDVKDRRRHMDFVSRYLTRCHHTAHIEKQDGDSGQAYPAYLSSAFGYESDDSKIPGNLTQDLRSKISWSILGNNPFKDSERAQLRREIATLFSRVGGDTRRPINDITLWEWGHTVGALYKSALAGALLGFKPQANDLRWRLLSIQFNGFAFFAEGHRLPDILARQELLRKALDKVRELIEVEYPMGAEVYRDENGSVFVVPGCEKQNCTLDVLSLSDNGKTLHQKIIDNLRAVVDGEIEPKLAIDAQPWWGQDPDWKNKLQQGQKAEDELPRVSEHLALIPTHHSPEWVSRQWTSRTEQICSVCSLRPQGPSQKAKDRNVCDICEHRRADRSKEWAQHNLQSTIWTDEVSDANGRLALIVGQFDITLWLDGALIQSLTVAEPAGTANDVITKNASFARIRRIWETTRLFWQNCLTPEAVLQAPARLAIIPEDAGQLDLGFYHVYDLVLTRGVKLSVVWDEEKKRFITAENLDYISKPEQLGQNVKTWLEQRMGQRLTLEEPTGYGSANKVWGEIAIQDVAEIPDSAYTSAIPILAEPRTFMALVPAYKALDMVQAIKEKYEREMGKVRNRLPLHLGIVYAHRRTPLRAILDAGRRMLKQTAPLVQEWKVSKDVSLKAGDLPDDMRASAKGTQQYNQWYPVKLENPPLGRSLTWYVPAVMGDGATPDQWYPYVFWEQDEDGNSQLQNASRNRERYFKTNSNPWSDTKGWLVHAGDLKKGDFVYFTPATLDFQWLDTAARRFEIAYDEHGYRQGQPHRPYLLDELVILQKIWNIFKKHLSKNQIYALRDTIEDKRKEWSPTVDECRKNKMFWKFCRDVLVNAEWRIYPWLQGQRDTWLDTWAEYASRGWLNDVVELHLQIMKEDL